MKDVVTKLQGSEDYLCGVYAILNFLERETPWLERPFYEILRICDERRWLTPDSLTHGFEDFQIKEMLDQHIQNWRLSFRTFYIHDVVRSPKNGFDDLVRRVCAQNGSLIAYVSGKRNHWVLITSEDAKPKVVNSSRSIEVKDLGLEKFSLEWGIVILRSDRAPLPNVI